VIGQGEVGVNSALYCRNMWGAQHAGVMPTAWSYKLPHLLYGWAQMAVGFWTPDVKLSLGIL